VREKHVQGKGRFSGIHEGAQSKKPRQAFAVFVLIVFIFYGKTKTAKPFGSPLRSELVMVFACCTPSLMASSFVSFFLKKS
jgi:hypothetical protein